MLAAYAPHCLSDVVSWSAQHALAPSAALRRFSFVHGLCRLADAKALGDRVVFKGGNALDLVWSPNRTSPDLDFTIEAPDSAVREVATWLCRELAQVFDGSASVEGIRAMATSVEILARGERGEFTVVRALVDLDGVELPAISPKTTIGLDFALADVSCESAPLALPGARRIRIATLDDLVAERLRAALHRPGGQDFVDIAAILKDRRALDLKKVRSYLLSKCARRQLTVSTDRYRDPALLARIKESYDELRPFVRRQWTPFEEASLLVQGLVDRLHI